MKRRTLLRLAGAAALTRWQTAIPASRSDAKPNRPPSEGFQFFGTLHASAKTRTLTVKLHDLSGKVIYTVELAP